MDEDDGGKVDGQECECRESKAPVTAILGALVVGMVLGVLGMMTLTLWQESNAAKPDTRLIPGPVADESLNAMVKADVDLLLRFKKDVDGAFPHVVRRLEALEQAKSREINDLRAVAYQQLVLDRAFADKFGGEWPRLTAAARAEVGREVSGAQEPAPQTNQVAKDGRPQRPVPPKK